MSRFESGLTKNNLGRYESKLAKLPDLEYRRKAEELDRVVRKVWLEIEQQLLPKRSKYGDVIK